MNIYKTPTPEEINEAAEKLIDPHAQLNDLEIFNIAISWLQNYQTQQQGAVRSAFEILEEKRVLATGQWLGNFCRDDVAIKAMHEFHNQFQTPASGGSEWINVQDRLPENQQRVLVWVDRLVDANIQIDKRRVTDSYGNTINSFRYDSITHWMPLPSAPGQSSQPQPNAISVIEEEIAWLRQDANEHPFQSDSIIPQIKLLESILTKLNK